MPRPKKLTQQVRREVYLPVNIAAILETLFLDPMSGRARYNSINVYINSLIVADLSRRGFLRAGEKQLDSSPAVGHNTGALPESPGETT